MHNSVLFLLVLFMKRRKKNLLDLIFFHNPHLCTWSTFFLIIAADETTDVCSKQGWKFKKKFRLFFSPYPKFDMLKKAVKCFFA